MAEKKYHANQLKNGTYICKIQYNGNRKSFYGKTDEEAISKAKVWYEEQTNVNKEDNDIPVPVQNDNEKLYGTLNEIVQLLKETKQRQDDDRYMTAKEVGAYLRISLGQAYGLINQPDFPRQKIGKSYRVSFLELKEYLKKHRFSQIEV